jgi:hypothetical protein
VVLIKIVPLFLFTSLLLGLDLDPRKYKAIVKKMLTINLLLRKMLKDAFHSHPS